MVAVGWCLVGGGAELGRWWAGAWFVAGRGGVVTYAAHPGHVAVKDGWVLARISGVVGRVADCVAPCLPALGWPASGHGLS